MKPVIALLMLLASLVVPSLLWAIAIMALAKSFGVPDATYRKSFSAAFLSLPGTIILYAVAFYSLSVSIYDERVLRQDLLLAGVVKAGWWSFTAFLVALGTHAVAIRVCLKAPLGKSLASALPLAAIFGGLDYFFRDWASGALVDSVVHRR